jgi:hypothetical protein
MRIVLISCVSKKQSVPARAAELYTSPLFKFNLAYARKLRADKTFILSAKYGLVKLDEIIAPYDKTLNEMPAKQIMVWADGVLSQLRTMTDVEHDEYVFLAGARYRKYLLPALRHHSIPLQGKGIGKQLKFLKEATS